MGILKRKQDRQRRPPIDENSDGVQHFFDGYFMELRERGRTYFAKIVEENAAHFRDDLNVTIGKVNEEIKSHLTERVDEQIAENGKIMKDAQEAALEALNRGIQDFQTQQKQLNTALQQNITTQQSAIGTMFEDNKTQIDAMKSAQATALQTLNATVATLQEQQQQLIDALQKNIANQEAMIIGAFEQNMAQVVEHYLLGALSDQFDLKAQLPSIIQQMEQNKQEIMDDMKL